MHVFTLSICCLMAPYLIVTTVNAAPTDCCMSLSSITLKPSRVKDYHIQQQGPLCPLQAIVLLTVKDRQVCVDPDSQWVVDVMAKVNKEKEAAKISGPTVAPSGGKKRPQGNGRGRGRGKGRGGKRPKGRGRGGRRRAGQQTQ